VSTFACRWKSWIKTGVKSIRVIPFQPETLNGVTDSVDHNLRRERERSNYSPGGNCAVIRAKWRASCNVIVKYSSDTVHVEDGRSRSVARGESPAIFVIVQKTEWIIYSILPLNIGGSPAVLKIIDSHLPVEVVVYAAKIQPQMGHLMNEERAGIQIFYVVGFLPFKS